MSRKALTEADYAVLKTDITVTNQAEFATYVTTNNDQPIADAYNAAFTPTFNVSKTNIKRREILFVQSGAGTSFTFNGNGFITRTVQELMAWNQLFSPDDDATDLSLANVQQALMDIFSGTGNAQANRQHIGNIGARPSLRIEKLYMVSGAGTIASPGILGYEGTLTARDVAHALRGVPLS